MTMCTQLSFSLSHFNFPIRHFLQDPNNKDRVYAAFAEGGLWVTDNFFDNVPNWRALTDQLGSLAASAVALGMNPGVIYYATGDPLDNRGLTSYLFISTDYGETWSDKINYGGGVAVWQIIAYSPDGIHEFLIISTDQVGIRWSSDGGKTFKVARQFGSVMSIVRVGFDFIGYDHLYGSFVRSTNAGSTFVRDPNSNFQALVKSYGAFASRTWFAQSNPGDLTVYAMVSALDGSLLDLFKSTDGGVNWYGQLNGVGVNANGIPINPIPGKCVLS